jgi:hypothetical protein
MTRWPAALVLVVALSGRGNAAIHGGALAPPFPQDKDRHGTAIVDGSFVHDVGELQLNITNWGLIGSRPSVPATYSNAPSAMWPAGSGVDYLFAAGLWVGGIKNGIPLVSTGQFENELLPGDNPLDTMYRMAEGDLGGARYPYPGEDDDGDGRINEDPKNGYDDDDDGLIDEDFAAVSEQEFRFVMRDDQPVAKELWPDHDPLGIEVIQESFQWSKPRLEDSIGFQFTIRNVGSSPIEDLFIGFFADADIGSRTGTAISTDDMVGFYSGSVVASDRVPLPISVAYMFDCDGDGGEAPGLIGFTFINSSRPPYPESIWGFHYFAGTLPFERGGDPVSDAQRYELLATPGIQRPPSGCRAANDYRILASMRPAGGAHLPPGGEVQVQAAIVMGEDVEDLAANVGEIALVYYGQWFDRDQDPTTGVRGRERRLCKSDFGDPRQPNSPIFNYYIDCGDPPPDKCGTFYPVKKISEKDLDRDGCVWMNFDCGYERARGVGCGTCTNDLIALNTDNACTGLAGKEFNVRWLAESPPPPPPMRVWETDNRVHVFWRSDPELETDFITGLPVFESYRLWRSDGWERPLGSSIETGPRSSSWTLMAEYDFVDTYEHEVGNIVEEVAMGANTGLDVIRYRPRVLRPDAPGRYAALSSLLDRIVAENPDLDYRMPIRYRDRLGVLTPLGERYPELEDWECCTAELDTLAWSKLGLQFYEFADPDVTNGIYYFYAVTVTTKAYDPRSTNSTPIGYGPAGQPRSNFAFAVPQSPAMTAEVYNREGANIYVVPNPATRQSLDEFSRLAPNSEDPTGVRVEFRNLPAARNVVTIYTLSGDRVAQLAHDGRNGSGSLSWNLVSRKGQQIVSGIYLFTVESEDRRFPRFVGRFVVIL